MQITVSNHEGRVPVTVMHLQGDLDARTYTDVVKKAEEAYGSGARHLLVDLSQVPFLSSAGLVALHITALIFAGEPVKSTATGHPSLRSLNPTRDKVAREHVKLLSPQPQLAHLLETVGLLQFFEVFEDLNTAVQSF